MAVSLPTSADVRKVRSQANKAVNSQLDMVRTPFLAWLGAGDLVVRRIVEIPTELRERLNVEYVRARVDEATEQARETYTELADRGEVALERIRTQPQMAQVVRTVEDADERLEKGVEQGVDQIHDTGEEVLGRVSTETRSVGEKAARAIQRAAGDTADAVKSAGEDVAGSVEDVGDEAARQTRGTTRKAANRAAPEKPATRRSNTR